MADNTYTVELIGEEDINWGAGTFTRQSRLTPGTTVSITQINASHVPVVDSGGLFTGTTVEAVLAEIKKMGNAHVRMLGIPSDGQADSTVVLLQADRALNVSAVKFIPDWDFDESASSYSEFKVINKGLAGAGSDVLATKTWNGDGTTNSAFVPIDFGSISNASVADGEVLALQVDSAESGEGTAFFPPGIYVVEYTW